MCWKTNFISAFKFNVLNNFYIETKTKREWNKFARGTDKNLENENGSMS